MKAKEMAKLLSEFTKLTRKCKTCGHSLSFIGRTDKVICRWCGIFIKTIKQSLNIKCKI